MVVRFGASTKRAAIVDNAAYMTHKAFFCGPRNSGPAVQARIRRCQGNINVV